MPKWGDTFNPRSEIHSVEKMSKYADSDSDFVLSPGVGAETERKLKEEFAANLKHSQPEIIEMKSTFKPEAHEIVGDITEDNAVAKKKDEPTPSKVEQSDNEEETPHTPQERRVFEINTVFQKE